MIPLLILLQSYRFMTVACSSGKRLQMSQLNATPSVHRVHSICLPTHCEFHSTPWSNNELEKGSYSNWVMDAQYPLDRKLVGPHSHCRRCAEGKNFQSLPGIETWHLIHPSRIQSLYRPSCPGFIQNVPWTKINILGGHSISHSKQNVCVHVSCSERFPR
jgi:hypothetical protein